MREGNKVKAIALIVGILIVVWIAVSHYPPEFGPNDPRPTHTDPVYGP